MGIDEACEQLYDAIREVVSGGSGTWQDKRDMVLSWMREHDDATMLGEFVTWFGGSVDEE